MKPTDNTVRTGNAGRMAGIAELFLPQHKKNLTRERQYPQEMMVFRAWRQERRLS
jgi:hypothetical protein